MNNSNQSQVAIFTIQYVSMFANNSNEENKW